MHVKEKTNQKNPQTSVSDLMLTNVPENWEKWQNCYSCELRPE